MTPTPSRDEILACPFCGNAPHVENAAPIGGAAMIYCRADECLGPSTTAATLQDAMVQWNTRLAVSASGGGAERDATQKTGIATEQTGHVLSVRAFAAWHPVEGFGPVNEIALRAQVDHAKTDANMLNHTGSGWEVVPVDIQKGHWF